MNLERDQLLRDEGFALGVATVGAFIRTQAKHEEKARHQLIAVAFYGLIERIEKRFPRKSPTTSPTTTQAAIAGAAVSD